MPWLTIHAMSWSSMFPASHLRVLWLWRIGNPITMLHIHCVIPRILNTLRGNAWLLLSQILAPRCHFRLFLFNFAHSWSVSPHVMISGFVFFGTHEQFAPCHAWLIRVLWYARTLSWASHCLVLGGHTILDFGLVIHITGASIIFVYSCSIWLTLGLCCPMSWLADSCSLVHTNKSPHVMLGWFVFYGMHEHFLGLLLALCLAVTQSWILGLSSTLWAHQHSLGISLIGSSSLVVFHTCVGYFFSLFFSLRRLPSWQKFCSCLVKCHGVFLVACFCVRVSMYGTYTYWCLCWRFHEWVCGYRPIAL